MSSFALEPYPTEGSAARPALWQPSTFMLDWLVSITAAVGAEVASHHDIVI